MKTKMTVLDGSNCSPPITWDLIIPEKCVYYNVHLGLTLQGLHTWLYIYHIDLIHPKRFASSWNSSRQNPKRVQVNDLHSTYLPLVQLASSELSRQSLSPSHTQSLWIHSPLAHVNWSEVQFIVPPGGRNEVVGSWLYYSTRIEYLLNGGKSTNVRPEWGREGRGG